MLRKTVPILCASALLMTLAACGGDDSAATTTTTDTTTAPEPPPPPPEPEPIRLRLKAGDAFTFKQTTTTDQLIGGTPQGDMKITMEVISAISYSVVSVSEAGDAAIKISFGRVHGKMNNPMMGEVEFDSEAPSDNPMVGMAAGQFTALSGSSVEATVSPQGEMSAFKGTEALAQKLLDANPMAAMQGMNLDTIKEQLEVQTAGQMVGYPEGAAKVGMTWNITRQQAAGGLDMTLSTDHELVSDDDDQYVIESITTGTQAEAEDGAPQQMTLDDFSSSGTTVVEQGNGVPVLVENDASIALSVEGPMGAMTVKQTISNRLERVEPGDDDEGDDDEDGGNDHGGGDDD